MTDNRVIVSRALYIRYNLYAKIYPAHTLALSPTATGLAFGHAHYVIYRRYVPAYPILTVSAGL